MSLKDLSLRECHIETVKACSGKDLLNNDWISDLPDDILIRILSSLTLKQVGSTSVLSKRWRHVWTYVPSLNFDCGDDFMHKLCFRSTPEKREEQELKYFRWVEEVVNSHKAYTIDEFIIRYDVHASRKDNIDNWLTFAMEKGVKRLQLYRRPFKRDYRAVTYTLPILSPSNTLISLKLYGVEVSGEVIEKLLCDCQALESVSVTLALTLVELKVAGSLNLKSLELWQVFEMRHLEISAPNLTSFYYHGPQISWPLISAPKLAEISFDGDYGLHIVSDFLELSNISSQIEVLTVHGLLHKSLSIMFPVFRRLKTLDFKFYPSSEMALFRITTLLTCCPLLNKFAVEYDLPSKFKMTKKTRNFKAFRHRHLKIFEIRSFTGCEVEIAFILLLTEGAVLAEKLIVNPGYKKTSEIQIKAEKEAEKLGAVIKPGLELEIRKMPFIYIY